MENLVLLVYIAVENNIYSDLFIARWPEGQLLRIVFEIVMTCVHYGTNLSFLHSVANLNIKRFGIGRIICSQVFARFIIAL